ncbi:MAG TPA: hypothetical protein DEB24_00805 [Coriobacteriia bacterium]|nr:hypothetical protein [Coriobacteriia bacterium]
MLSFFGAISGFAEKADSSQSPILLVDVGGGSTELVLGTRSSDDGVPEIIRAHSFDIGSSRITESFFETDPPTFEEMARARSFIDTTLDAFFKENEVVPAGVIAVAGTATTVVSVRDALRVYNPRKVHGQTVTVDELSSVFERLSALSVRQRRECVGLEPDRAPVILGGIAVLRSVMDFLPENKLVVSETDLLQGILLGRDRLRV